MKMTARATIDHASAWRGDEPVAAERRRDSPRARITRDVGLPITVGLGKNAVVQTRFDTADLSNTGPTR